MVKLSSGRQEAVTWLSVQVSVVYDRMPWIHVLLSYMRKVRDNVDNNIGDEIENADFEILEI